VGQKSKSCPYCGAKNRLSGRVFLAYASTPDEALRAVRRLKAGKNLTRERNIIC